jgi:3-phosphoshikimate 1-carboxyvinyltransferase
VSAADLWRVDARRLTPARLAPPVSKSDAQRALALSYAAGDPALMALPDDEADLPVDVRVLRRGLEVLAARPGEGEVIDCLDGGAPFRFLLGLAAVTRGARVRFTGSRRLGERPVKPLLEALSEALTPGGLSLRVGSPWPIELSGAGEVAAPRFAISAGESSQFATSLLLAAAYRVAREARPWVVELVGPTASPGYLDLTLEWLSRAGFSHHRSGGVITLSGFSAPVERPAVPGDWSSLGYLLLIAWRAGGEVARVDPAAAHPDRAVLRVLSEIGLTVEARSGGVVFVSGAPSGGLSASGGECPDLLPTLAALACVLPGPSTLTEVSILRGKESDRLEGIRALVAAGGGQATLNGDSLRIEPGAAPARLALESRGDHRLAMSAVTLAALLGAELDLVGGSCVEKSFPGFWREVRRAGVIAEAQP